MLPFGVINDDDDDDDSCFWGLMRAKAGAADCVVAHPFCAFTGEDFIHNEARTQTMFARRPTQLKAGYSDF